MFKIGFILNGKGRRKKKFFKELEQVRENVRDIEFNVVETSESGHAQSLASEFANEGYSHLIAVGGDGTLHEALNGLMKNFNPEIVLGNYPLGTANDFIKSINTPKSLTSLFQSVRSNDYQTIDIGRIQTNSEERFFINIADIGLGAEVVKRVNKSSKFLGADLTFSLAILRSLWSYKNLPVTCKASEWEYKGKVKSLVMANGRYFGSGLCIAPDASLNDGKFQITVFGDISVRDYIKHSQEAKKGLKISHQTVDYKMTNAIEITTAEKCGIEADGEFVGYCPATFSVVPNKVRFLIV